LKKFFPLFLTLFFILNSCGKKATQNPQKESIVTVIIIEEKDTPVSFENIAQVQSAHLVNIQARVTGFLEQRVYTEGEMVKEGQVLFFMDKKPFQAQVDAAKAALTRQEAAFNTARLNLERIKPLVEKKALSQKDLDDAVGSFESSAALVDQAKAQLETANLNLSYCTITSPLTGITSAALQQEGSYINVTDSKLTTVSELSPIWVNFSLSENQLQDYRNQIANGFLLKPTNDEYEVEIILTDGSLFPQTGKITFREPYYNSQTGTFLIRATVENPEGILRPNQFVKTRVNGAIRPKAIVIPQRAVQQSTKGHFVWVVNKESKVTLRPVKVGEWYGEDWFIYSGLQSGEKVVIDGSQTLTPGQVVKIRQ
jgi:membrane fusion protein (multidrug efflux system)